MIFRQKSSKIDYFGFGPDSLSFTVTQIQLLPVWGNFVIFRQKSSKIDHFSFGPDSLSFTVTQIQLLPFGVIFMTFRKKNDRKLTILVSLYQVIGGSFIC
jgi:hypothetical protein